jgi:signal transduction histidine kinase
LLLANNPTLKNKKKIINLLNDSTIYSYSVNEELKKIVSHKKTITQSQLKRLKKVLEKEKYIATRNREGVKKYEGFFQSVMFYVIAFIFFIISILVIIFELLTPYRNWLGISIDNKDKINQYFKWGGVFIVVTVITLILLVTLIKSNPGNYLILSEFLSPLTSTIDTFNMYYRSPEQGSKLQLLLLVPVVFSLVAIMVILYAKKQLTRYVIKLAQGEKVDPPRIRLQEFSQIVESIDTLQKRLKGKKYIETFISSIAHEVRTPLAGIRANTESLSLSMDSDNFGQAKDNIIESNNRMLLIIDSLLELAKLEQQNKTLEKTRCNINSIIENIINEPNIIKKLKDKNVSISFNKPNHCGADANKFLIEMCLLNMINNAIDFSLNNGIIWINATDNQNNISIEILDEGIGIPDNMLNKIQNKFVSTSRPYTNKRSTGLGLSLIKIIMDLHDGEFEISNRHDTKGVVAKLNFPKFRCQL